MISKGAQNILKDFSWPGNVRELANAIERVMILKSGKLPVTSADLTFLAMGAVPSTLPNNTFKLPPSGIDYDGLQKEVVQQALDLANSNQSSAARLLGLSRARFRTLMKMMEDS